MIFNFEQKRVGVLCHNRSDQTITRKGWRGNPHASAGNDARCFLGDELNKYSMNEYNNNGDEIGRFLSLYFLQRDAKSDLHAAMAQARLLI